MEVKEAFDEILGDVKFDEKLVNKLMRYNIKFTTSNPDLRDMFGGKLIGCYNLSYTQYHKNLFYEELFGLSYDKVLKQVKKITTMVSNFVVSGDDLNLMCFYIAHRFLSNTKLDPKKRKQGAIEAFNYFGYRSMILYSIRFFPHPITKDKALSLYESLSRSFLITKHKNWNACVHYRSNAYVNSKFLGLVMELTNEEDLPNAINDLANRYKEMFKYIAGAFNKLEDNNLIKSTKNVVSDKDGREVLLDRLHDSVKYVDNVKDALVSKGSFIRDSLIENARSTVNSVSYDDVQQALSLTMDYIQASATNTKQVYEFIEDFITDSIEYLRLNKSTLNPKSNIVEVVAKIVGNLLYSRGTTISITEVKNKGIKLLDDIYSRGKVSISKRNLTGVRNVFCIYILLLALVG